MIDLSADFRIKDAAVYEEWYGIEHKAKQYLDEAVYGLCEINREAVKKARLVANPGCYPTCSILSIYPLLKEGLIDLSTVIIDAKSGTSGAGRGAKVDNLFCEVNENIKAYGVATHRHTPEIEQGAFHGSGRTHDDQLYAASGAHAERNSCDRLCFLEKRSDLGRSERGL